ncbi:MAG: AAA family ATPase, partial [Planktothrix sp.]
MVEKLIIDNFAGIEHLEIEVKKINIMIGPQASGKSVCAKLLFYFKEFIFEIIKSVEEKKTKRQLESSYSNKFKEFFPPKFWGNHEFNLRYEINDHFVQIYRNHNKSSLLLDYSDFYKSALSKLRKIDRQRQNKKLGILNLNPLEVVENRSNLMDIFEKNLGKNSTFFQYFIPAGRSFFAYIGKNIFSILSNQKSLDPFIINFGG